MIAVEVREDHVEVTGHAGYAEKGNDIVCAAVSILFQNLYNSIQSLTEDKVKIDIMPGDSRIGYKDLSETSKNLIDSFFIGICSISEQYPDYVKIM